MINLGKSDWVSVFQARDVWDLNTEKIERWKTNNASFFAFIREYVPAGGKILEIGCGPARHAISLASLGYAVTATDVREDILEAARKNEQKVLGKSSIDFRLSDINALSTAFPPHSF